MITPKHLFELHKNVILLRSSLFHGFFRSRITRSTEKDGYCCPQVHAVNLWVEVISFVLLLSKCLLFVASHQGHSLDFGIESFKQHRPATICIVPLFAFPVTLRHFINRVSDISTEHWPGHHTKLTLTAFISECLDLVLKHRFGHSKRNRFAGICISSHGKHPQKQLISILWSISNNRVYVNSFRKNSNNLIYCS